VRGVAAAAAVLCSPSAISSINISSTHHATQADIARQEGSSERAVLQPIRHPTALGVTSSYGRNSTTKPKVARSSRVRRTYESPVLLGFFVSSRGLETALGVIYPHLINEPFGMGRYQPKRTGTGWHIGRDLLGR
jgi:hypothetical protein